MNQSSTANATSTAIKDVAQGAASLPHTGAPSGKATEAMNFRQRMMLCFAVVAVSTTLLFVAVLTVVWNNQFNDYTRTTMDELATTTASTLADFYDTRGYWSTTNLEGAARVAASMEDVGIQILNANGVVIYDSTLIGLHGAGQATSEMLDMSLAPTDTSTVVTKPIVSSEGNTVGTVRVWVYGSDLLYTQRDLDFRNSSIGAMALAGATSVLLAIAMGLAFSRALTRPVRTISAAAQRIKEGDLSARSGVSGSDDLGQLGETFDSMAESIERDRELERRLTSDVAHELRTPLMAILATVEAMEDEVLPCDQEHLALVAGETKRLSRLVDSMLRLSRLENGSVRFDFETVDAVQFVSGIATSHAMLLEDMGLTMTFANKTGYERVPVELDRDTITQAVTNIISNAMRYTPAPGEVEVSLSLDGDRVAIAVRDTGIGIAKEDIGKLFGRFWRAEESRNRVAGGLGVGLAVTKEIIDRHHGRIGVESEKGVGTTFTLYIPMVQPFHEGE